MFGIIPECFCFNEVLFTFYVWKFQILRIKIQAGTWTCRGEKVFSPLILSLFTLNRKQLKEKRKMERKGIFSFFVCIFFFFLKTEGWSKKIKKEKTATFQKTVIATECCCPTKCLHAREEEKTLQNFNFLLKILILCPLPFSYSYGNIYIDRRLVCAEEYCRRTIVRWGYCDKIPRWKNVINLLKIFCPIFHFIIYYSRQQILQNPSTPMN